MKDPKGNEKNGFDAEPDVTHIKVTGPEDDMAQEAASDTAQEAAGEVADLTDRLQRLRAEFENYKKRVAREADQRGERTSDQILLDILPLYDALGLAFENYNRDKDAQAFLSGAERIFAQFEQILSNKGVSRIEAVGRMFDPAVHEALLSLESDQLKNTIIEEFSPGYMRDGRTIRPSKVGVSQGTAPAKEEEE